jgi:hypothetical protein
VGCAVHCAADMATFVPGMEVEPPLRCAA